MNEGVIYYNTGTGCAVRLLVSLYSLRKHYAGPVTILSEGAESHRLARPIAEALDASVVEWDSGVSEGKNHVYLTKPRYSQATPYDVTVALDADTLVLGTIVELFEKAHRSQFCVSPLGQWRSSGRTIAGRIRKWSPWVPADMMPAIRFGPAVNIGVMAFHREAEIFREWQDLVERGRDTFIPDEVSCQVILHRYPHEIIDTKWNRSCKYDDPQKEGTRIIHYHGKKHCRKDLPFHANQWVRAYEEVVAQNLANIQAWTPAGDRKLSRYLRSKVSENKNGQAGRSNEPAPTLHATNIILGAKRTAQPGWLSTDKETLDIRSLTAWQRLVGTNGVERLLAEHVWDQLTEEQGRLAAAHAYTHLQPGGTLRIAVPDGLHPDAKYRESATGDGRTLYTAQSLMAMLRDIGFEVVLLEHWDQQGQFHWQEWEWRDGYVARSFRFDRRNRNGKPNYTSLIVDAKKPKWS